MKQISSFKLRRRSSQCIEYVELSEETINKIADAVVSKLKAESAVVEISNINDILSDMLNYPVRDQNE